MESRREMLTLNKGPESSPFRVIFLVHYVGSDYDGWGICSRTNTQVNKIMVAQGNFFAVKPTDMPFLQRPSSEGNCNECF
jgi:hypothetical protein